MQLVIVVPPFGFLNVNIIQGAKKGGGRAIQRHTEVFYPRLGGLARHHALKCMTFAVGVVSSLHPVGSVTGFSELLSLRAVRAW